MSSSLDNWGLHQAIAVDATGSPTHLHPEPEPARPPMLSLLSLDLETWGSKTQGGSLRISKADIVDKATEHVSNPLAQVFLSESNLFDRRGFQTKHSSFFLAPQNKNTQFGGMLLIVLVLAMLLGCLCYEGVSLDDAEVVAPNKEEQDFHDYHRQEAAAGSGFATVEYSDGSWAQVYREAQGEQKEALELLFRCNIISTDEFAFSSVSQEHIQECIWIATHMLRQKPLEEWVALWQQAQQTFEDSVTACFQARGGPHSNEEYQVPQMGAVPLSSLSLGAVPLSGVSKWSSSVGGEEDEDDPYTTRSHYTPGDGIREPRQYGSQAPPPPEMHPLHTQESHLAVEDEDSRCSVETELDKGLAVPRAG